MGRAPCCDKANVKKGPWSPEEDKKLKEFIEKYGTGGNWIALPRKAGLKRCGKSCRLRWLNYLRPNIKHGQFSDEEDRIICTLFARIGSRWSIMASQLPGRTDNDIKNYWNTKLKKKLMGIPPSQRKAHQPAAAPPPPPQVFPNSYDAATTQTAPFQSSCGYISDQRPVFSGPECFPVSPEILRALTAASSLLYETTSINTGMLVPGGDQPAGGCTTSDGVGCNGGMSYGVDIDGVCGSQQMDLQFQSSLLFSCAGMDDRPTAAFLGSPAAAAAGGSGGRGDGLWGEPAASFVNSLDEIKQLISSGDGGVCNSSSFDSPTGGAICRPTSYYRL